MLIEIVIALIFLTLLLTVIDHHHDIVRSQELYSLHHNNYYTHPLATTAEFPCYNYTTSFAEDQNSSFLNFFTSTLLRARDRPR